MKYIYATLSCLHKRIKVISLLMIKLDFWRNIQREREFDLFF